ncbi:MAG: hypothetical protein AABX83_01935 [Nanoarchaeota archaeon]
MDNYNQLLLRVSEAAGLSVSDIERKIEAKRAKLSGLVSKEGAVQIIAAELGINFDQERMKIAELVHGMKRANVIGKILEIYPVREYNKNGRAGKVCNLLIADESSNVKTVLWDLHHIELIENGKLEKGNVVEISNASVRNGELHLSTFSDIKNSKENLKNVVMEKVFHEKKIIAAINGERFKTRAVIVQIFDPRYFEVCPECGKKVANGECTNGHGKVEGKKRALLSIVLDDGSETIRCVLFGEQIKKLGFDDEEIFSLEKFVVKKEGLLGEEKFFCGNVKANSLSNVNELNIEDITDIDSSKLIKELESRSV